MTGVSDALFRQSFGDDTMGARKCAAHCLISNSTSFTVHTDSHCQCHTEDYGNETLGLCNKQVKGTMYSFFYWSLVQTLLYDKAKAQKLISVKWAYFNLKCVKCVHFNCKCKHFILKYTKQLISTQICDYLGNW